MARRARARARQPPGRPAVCDRRRGRARRAPAGRGAVAVLALARPSRRGPALGGGGGGAPGGIGADRRAGPRAHRTRWAGVLAGGRARIQPGLRGGPRDRPRARRPAGGGGGRLQPLLRQGLPGRVPGRAGAARRGPGDVRRGGRPAGHRRHPVVPCGRRASHRRSPEGPGPRRGEPRDLSRDGRSLRDDGRPLRRRPGGVRRGRPEHHGRQLLRGPRQRRGGRQPDRHGHRAGPPGGQGESRGRPPAGHAARGCLGGHQGPSPPRGRRAGPCRSSGPSPTRGRTRSAPPPRSVSFPLRPARSPRTRAGGDTARP